MKRKEYKHNNGTPLEQGDSLVVKGRAGKDRIIKPGKWWIDRNTPVGDDADLYELKPWNGRRYVPWGDIIAVLKEKES